MTYWPAIAMAGASLISGMQGAKAQRGAQQSANRINLQIAQEQAAEQARQFDVGTGIQEQQFGYQSGQQEARFGYEQQAERERALDLQSRFDLMRGQNIARIDPYSQAGQAAVTERSALLGLSGAEAQEAAMSRFTEGAGQRFLRERQEKSLLRSGSKIGALGGGNIRTALQEQAFNRAQTDYDRQLARLSGVAGEGLQAGAYGIQAGYGPQVGVSSTPYQQHEAYSPFERPETEALEAEEVVPEEITGAGGVEGPIDLGQRIWDDPSTVGAEMEGEIDWDQRIWDQPAETPESEEYTRLWG